jgi:hypothetical protein
MKALTLTQPWCALVASGIKLIENRSWRGFQAAMIGQRFALHASREVDESVFERIAEVAPELCWREPDGVRWSGTEWIRTARITSAVLGVATVDRVVRESDGGLFRMDLADDQARWFFGPLGIVLRDVRMLAEPFTCKGALGFWSLSELANAAVEAQL